MLSNDLLPGAQAAAEYLGVSRSTVYHMAKRGNLPTIRKGRRLYFRKSDLEAAFRADPTEVAANG